MGKAGCRHSWRGKKLDAVALGARAGVRFAVLPGGLRACELHRGSALMESHVVAFLAVVCVICRGIFASKHPALGGHLALLF